LNSSSYLKKPKDFKEIFSKSIIYNTLMAGIWISIISIVGYIIGTACFDNKYAGMSIAFVTLSFSQTVHAFNMQSNTVSMFSRQNKFNKWIPILSLSSLLIVVCMIIAAYYGGSITSTILGIDTDFAWWVWPIIIVFGITIIPFLEVLKFFERRSIKKNEERNQRV
ncbi:MAG: cation transporting ATPase C-terminal domain-containing protein, partial [Mycoplasmataceae bacterium]|nr:cation transporting ATPase C-terminal domain-containing protein [Mycoplasmataceae bacterium]